MSSSFASRAQSEYYQRPADERFASLQALITHAQGVRDHSAERHYNLKDLRATVQQVPNAPDQANPDRVTGSRPSLMLESPRGSASFTHYSFGQLARTIGAPAAYLRQLPPQLAADCLNHGLKDSPAGTVANLLVREPNGTPDPIIRACTSDSYGRVWDAELYGALDQLFSRRTSSGQGEWQIPPTWTGEPGGVYRGDRDSFVIMVDGGSIVEDPSLRASAAFPTATSSSPAQGRSDSGAMYRGIMVRNSEVGHCSITIETVLFRYICGNHMLWGAILDRTFRRRHVGTKITRDTMRELGDLAYRWTDRSASADESLIRHLITREIAHTKEAVIDELRKMGATKDQATQAYETAERTESASPRSFWGVAQGLTRNSQESGYQDDRLQLDQLAAQILKRGQLVAA
jgi:hypothetical protein